jgi:hypothetical protein
MIRDRFEKYPGIVIPAKTKIREILKEQDSCFRGKSDLPGFWSHSRGPNHGSGLSEIRMAVRGLG